ncbi:thiamine pyrophosphate-dependent enzyme [Aneurinibacillus terranovensis]|uniref:thiamine pyrophosphate-dependent enzyme n=1 Tax=Aneurinibacillus terranovensis TaxID=278991 RepID=UPI0009D66E97|nr:thiamine pyrophosphate-dependent enzyme [Aneurinibacillus terranovensis]
MKSFSPKSYKIHVNIYPAELNKNIEVDFPVTRDIQTVLSEVQNKLIRGNTKEWISTVASWHKNVPRFDTSFSALKPQKVIQILTSAGLGTMGYGLPAAIGASLASPGRQVVCISGDGSLQMNLQELMTAVDFQLPIKITTCCSDTAFLNLYLINIKKAAILSVNGCLFQIHVIVCLYNCYVQANVTFIYSYTFFSIFSKPPIYGRRASGMSTLPSSCW